MAKEEVKPEIFDEIKKKVKEEAHKEYSTFVGFMGVVIRTFNPLSYKKLCMASSGQGLRYYFHILALSFLLFLICSAFMTNFVMKQTISITLLLHHKWTSTKLSHLKILGLLSQMKNPMMVNLYSSLNKVF